MSKENRSIFLVALTYVAFASIGLIRNGSFLFPFPLNELVFFILFLRFAFWHRKERLSILLVGIAASASLLSSSFFWEIILSTTDQAQLFQSTPDRNGPARLVYLYRHSTKPTNSKNSCLDGGTAVAPANDLSMGVHSSSRLCFPEYFLLSRPL